MKFGGDVDRMLFSKQDGQHQNDHNECDEKQRKPVLKDEIQNQIYAHNQEQNSDQARMKTINPSVRLLIQQICDR